MPCCGWLKLKAEYMNQNGMTVVPRERFGRRFFAVRFRWVDPLFWEKLSGQLPQMTPFATAAEIAINHCPGCGAPLAGWIQQNPEEFGALLAQVVD
jgi:hypothetical protein